MPLQAGGLGRGPGCREDGGHAQVDGFFVFQRAGSGAGFEQGCFEDAVFVAHAHCAIHEMQQGDFGASQGDAGAAGFDAMDVSAG